VGYKTFSHIIDAIFIIDVLFNFRTTISDFITGDEVVCGKVIAWKYLKGRFILDLVAAIPFELI